MRTYKDILLTWVITFIILCEFPSFSTMVEAKARPTGTLNALVLMVDFSDKPGQVQRSYFENLIFGSNPSIAPLGSFVDYYSEVSYGQTSITGQVNDGITNWYRMPQTYSYYVNNQYGFGTYPQNVQKLVEDAIAAAKTSGIDFGPLDNDNDGYADALFIVHAGQGAEFTDCTCDIWSHYMPFDSALSIDTGSFNALGNKVYVRDYTIEPEYFTTPNDMTIGVFTHEFGHVLGLPDLYDRDSTSQGLGNWSLMAGGSWNGPNGLGDSPAHPDAWLKKKLGWVKPSLPASGNITIPQVETNKSIYQLCPSTQGQEYFLLENRQRTGFDVYLPGDGLAIYHIDESITTQNDMEWYPGCTTCTSHYLAALEQADGYWDLEKKFNAGDNGDMYPGIRNNKTFNTRSTPNSKNYAGQTTGVSISESSNSGSTMTATVKTSSPTNTFSIINNVTLSDNGSIAAVAYDGTNYFVVWSELRNGYYNIYGARVTTCGKVLDPGGIPISIGSSDRLAPSIAFDGKNYLVVWEDWYRNCTGGACIYGTIISPLGEIITPGDFVITTSPAWGRGPSVAFDGSNYLVVWSDDNVDIVNGTRIDPNGTILSNILISAIPGTFSPSVAFGGDNYLVTWAFHAYGPTNGIQATLVTPSGNIGEPLIISSGDYPYGFPSVSFNPISNQFLVVWHDYRNPQNLTDIYGQLVSRNGTLIGSNQSLAIAPNNQWIPSVGFDGTNHFVVWSDYRDDVGGGDIYGTRIDSSGFILDPNGKAIVATRKGEGFPGIGCSGFNCLVVYGYEEKGIFGLFIWP